MAVRYADSPRPQHRKRGFTATATATATATVAARNVKSNRNRNCRCAKPADTAEPIRMLTGLTIKGLGVMNAAHYTIRPSSAAPNHPQITASIRNGPFRASAAFNASQKASAVSALTASTPNPSAIFTQSSAG